MNPAVTLAFTSIKEFDKNDTVPYIIATILGALVAGFVFINFIKCKNPKECSI
jgi:glycerol uptake facilitator-like aquaporin